MTENDQSDGVDTEMDDSTVDVVGTIEPENAHLSIEAGPLYTSFAKGVTGGLRVVQDGDFMAIAQGVDYSDGDWATVGHDLTPSEAREFARILLDAADYAEEAAHQKNSEENDKESMLRSLLE